MRIDETNRGNNLFPHIDGWDSNQFVCAVKPHKGRCRNQPAASLHVTGLSCPAWKRAMIPIME